VGVAILASLDPWPGVPKAETAGLQALCSGPLRQGPHPWKRGARAGRRAFPGTGLHQADLRCARMNKHLAPGRMSITSAQVLRAETPMSSELIKHITDDSFSTDVLQSDKPVLVDYWAEWCGPCKAIAPVLDEVSKAYDGKLQVAKMNVDENRDIPAKFGIRGIPTLMLFKNGELAATKVGALNKAQLTAFLDGHL
jgi:thioredoxin 1